MKERKHLQKEKEAAPQEKSVGAIIRSATLAERRARRMVQRTLAEIGVK